MTRYKLIIEYDGTLFVGWQRQQNGKSVQGELEAALFDLTKVKVQVHGAGRTDSGVHAEGQVAHCDIAREISTDTLRDALNHFLRKVPISVLSVEEVTGTFHARFCALKRHYLYRILNRRPPPTLDKNRIWWTPSRLDEKAMQMAPQTIVGTHDFSSFRPTRCQAKSPINTLDHLDVERIGDEIRVTTSAKSFLQHQVRNLVGTLTMVGYGKWNLDDVRVVLNAQDRSLAGPTAPASGLYLVQVDYP